MSPVTRNAPCVSLGTHHLVCDAINLLLMIRVKENFWNGSYSTHAQCSIHILERAIRRFKYEFETY